MTIHIVEFRGVALNTPHIRYVTVDYSAPGVGKATYILRIHMGQYCGPEFHFNSKQEAENAKDKLFELIGAITHEEYFKETK